MQKQSLEYKVIPRVAKQQALIFAILVTLICMQFSLMYFINFKRIHFIYLLVIPVLYVLFYLCLRKNTLLITPEKVMIFSFIKREIKWSDDIVISKVYDFNQSLDEHSDKRVFDIFGKQTHQQISFMLIKKHEPLLDINNHFWCIDDMDELADFLNTVESAVKPIQTVDAKSIIKKYYTEADINKYFMYGALASAVLILIFILQHSIDAYQTYDVHLCTWILLPLFLFIVYKSYLYAGQDTSARAKITHKGFFSLFVGLASIYFLWLVLAGFNTLMGHEHQVTFKLTQADKLKAEERDVWVSQDSQQYHIYCQKTDANVQLNVINMVNVNAKKTLFFTRIRPSDLCQKRQKHQNNAIHN